jgi:hypothetical protein
MKVPRPQWIGEQPIIEGITFGYGSYGYRCRLCGQDNWEGALVHLPGCPGEGETQPPAAEIPGENPNDPDLWEER